MNILELVQQNPQEAIDIVTKAAAAEPDNLDAQQLAAEVCFELGLAEQAYGYLQQTLHLDPDGTKGGYDKFLWLGQLIGGKTGINYYKQGINGLRQQPVEQSGPQIIKGLLGMIDIYMTDLCMEPEAEQVCEKLIAEALLLDDNHAEAWSILGSIRISQIRNDEAKQALEKSWSLFDKALLEAQLDPTSMPALVRLAQSMIELEMADLVLDLTTQATRLDDQVPDLYYLNALAHQQLMGQEPDPAELNRHNAAIRDAIELLSQLDESVDPEMATASNELVASLPPLTEPVPESDDENVEE